MADAAVGLGWEKVYVGKEEVEMRHMKRGIRGRCGLLFGRITIRLLKRMRRCWSDGEVEIDIVASFSFKLLSDLVYTFWRGK